MNESNAALTKTQSDTGLTAEQILDTALELAQQQDSWVDLSLTDLARHCDLSVNDIRQHYPDTNAIANAWFERALVRMLTPGPETDPSITTKDRLACIIWRWFAALAPYHRTTSQMLAAKLHLPHIHHWVPMVFDLSRLVQLWRDSAGLHAGGRRRQLEEIVLTGIFLSTLQAWCRDESPQQGKAHSRLLRLLSQAERSAPFRNGDKAQ